MGYVLREMKKAEYAWLDEFLYEAIFIPEGAEAPKKSIIQMPELQVYIEGFGTKKDDHCIVAEAEDGMLMGAAWVRIMNDFGHVDDETPSLAISLYKQHRGQGAGTAMLSELLARLKRKGYRQTSLAVQKANYAVRMYTKLGYEIVGENEEEYIMVNRLAVKRGAML